MVEITPEGRKWLEQRGLVLQRFQRKPEETGRVEVWFGRTSRFTSRVILKGKDIGVLPDGRQVVKAYEKWVVVPVGIEFEVPYSEWAMAMGIAGKRARLIRAVESHAVEIEVDGRRIVGVLWEALPIEVRKEWFLE